MTYLGSKDWLFEVGMGRVAGHTMVHKFGRNPDCDQAGSATIVPVGRDIWDLGIAGASQWVPPTTARTHQLASSDDEDGGAGTDTGALTIRIWGLSATWAEQTEDITLNGTTNVPTASTYANIHRMQVLTTGSAQRNLGNITATADTDTTVTAQVSADMGSTLMTQYQVPAAKTGIILSWGARLYRAGGGSKFADNFLMTKDYNATWSATPWVVKDDLPTGSSATMVAHHVSNLHVHVPAKGFLKVVSDPSADAQDIGAGWELVLVDD